MKTASATFKKQFSIDRSKANTDRSKLKASPRRAERPNASQLAYEGAVQHYKSRSHIEPHNRIDPRSNHVDRKVVCIPIDLFRRQNSISKEPTRKLSNRALGEKSRGRP